MTTKEERTVAIDLAKAYAYGVWLTSENSQLGGRRYHKVDDCFHNCESGHYDILIDGKYRGFMLKETNGIVVCVEGADLSTQLHVTQLNEALIEELCNAVRSESSST